MTVQNFASIGRRSSEISRGKKEKKCQQNIRTNNGNANLLPLCVSARYYSAAGGATSVSVQHNVLANCIHPQQPQLNDRKKCCD